jgi:nucleoside-diphosphate-sugar epimerase
MTEVVVLGATGQIGAALVPALRARCGADAVLAVGHRRPPPPSLGDGPFARVDVTDREAVRTLLSQHAPRAVYHLAALLSAVGEERPDVAWRVNMEGLRAVLDACREHEGVRLFWPSSIAVFGPDAPREQTPQDAPTRPTTMYGVTKVAGELLAAYYRRRFGLDVRGLRFPGLVSSETVPGGGTTDYAVAIFHAALREGRYRCFVRADTVLPMVYMPDAVRAALELMDADASALRHLAYNLGAMRFSAGELADAIAARVPGFACTYEPDFRQAIADGWPATLDDAAARRDWGWREGFDLDAMVEDMLTRLRPSSTPPPA